MFTFSPKQHWGRHIYVLVGFFMFASGVFGFYLTMGPFGADNLISLSLGAEPSLLTFFTHSLVNYLPIYRPVSIATIWLQYRLVGVAPLSYFVVNIVIWVLCAFLVYFFLYIYLKSRLVAILAAGLMLVDIRSASALYWIIERQTTLAILFGGLAMLIWFLYQDGYFQKHRRGVAFLVYFLLLLASLSKEYGISFTGAILVMALVSSSRKRGEKYRIAVVALIVVASYGVLRFGVAKSNLQTDYCEKIGYRSMTLSVCYGDYSTVDRIKFYMWNAGATFVGTFIPTLFNGYGQWVGWISNNAVSQIQSFFPPTVDHLPKRYNPIFVHFEFSLFGVILCMVALYKSPRKSLPWLALIVFNAMLNFLLYRTRNQLIGVSGMYVLMGIGLFELVRISERVPVRKFAFYGSVVALLWFGAYKAAEYSTYLMDLSHSYAREAPCESVAAFPNKQAFDRNVIREVNLYYGLTSQAYQTCGW
ncbi:hypothetical protein D6779_06420 [Candidatus Parcubacteria bacterium]|nr:MAG: hypothetical protein D6779_06420 [Candidatus Parcubacteria bacterium]